MLPRPPRLRVPQIRPERVTFALPPEPAACDPAPPELAQIAWAARQRAAHSAGMLRIAQKGVPHELLIMVPERHGDIASVAAHDHVAGVCVVRQSIQWEMSLDDSSSR